MRAHGVTRQPDYFPPASGRYEVAPGLVRFGKDLGGGLADRQVFQVDGLFPTARAGKLAARRERLAKYHCTSDLAPAVAAAVVRWIVGRLCIDHPTQFQQRARPDGIELVCYLTGEVLQFDAAHHLAGATGAPVDPPYAGALDALACQVQEDVAIVSTSHERHWLSALHLCFPNRWSAEEKIGRSFAAIHEPVAGMEAMNRRQEQFVRMMLEATEGLVRFAWGITFDDRLNQHPAHAPTRVDPSHPRAFLRVERQTIWGFPQVGAALFTIRTYLTDVEQIRRDPVRRQQLASAIASMSPASLDYKGLAEPREALLTWLTRA